MVGNVSTKHTSERTNIEWPVLEQNEELTGFRIPRLAEIGGTIKEKGM